MNDRYSRIHCIVPATLDDPLHPSGGNRYDRRVIDGLIASGRDVSVFKLAGDWDNPQADATNRLARHLDTLEDGALVLVDGLIGVAAPSLFVHAARRLHLVVLLHMPFAEAAPPERHADVAACEQHALMAARSIITTSDWTRRWIMTHYRLDDVRIHVAQPGTDAATVTEPSSAGDRWLCVGTLSPVKGQDVLLSALAMLGDRVRECTFIGADGPDGGFADALRGQADAAGLADRVVFAGARSPAAVDAAYARSDLVILPSRHEAWGMVATEALARGIPVLASDVGGVTEALRGDLGELLPGVTIRPGDAFALADELRRWLSEPTLRTELRKRALRRRAALKPWLSTVERVSIALQAGLR